MERTAFVHWLVASLIVIDLGLLTTPIVFGRKGYPPRIGVAIGATAGLVGALVGLFIFTPLIHLVLEILQSVFGILSDDITFADDLKFGISIGTGQNPLPIKFDTEVPLDFGYNEQRRRTLEFIRALTAGLWTFIGGYGALRLFWHFIPATVTTDSILPEGEDLQRSTLARQIRGRILRTHYMAAIVIGLVALMALLWNITKGSFTMNAVADSIDPVLLTEDDRTLADLDATELADILTTETLVDQEDQVSGQKLQQLVAVYVLDVDSQTARDIRNKSLSDVLDDDQKFSDFPNEMTWRHLGLAFRDQNHIVVGLDTDDTPLQNGDILTRVGSTEIDLQGLSKNKAIAAVEELLAQAAVGAIAEQEDLILEVFRNGRLEEVEIPYPDYQYLFELGLPLVEVDNPPVELSFVSGDLDPMPASLQASIDILGKNVDRETMVSLVYTTLSEQGTLPDLIVTRFYNDLAGIDDFDQGDIYQLAQDYVNLSDADAFATSIGSPLADILTKPGNPTPEKPTGGYLYEDIVLPMLEQSIAGLDDEMLLREAGIALTDEMLATYDADDLDRERLETELYDRYQLPQDEIGVQAKVRGVALIKGYINNMPVEDLRQVLIENFDSFEFNPALRTFATKRVYTADEDALLDIVGGPDLSKLKINTYRFADSLVRFGGYDAMAMRGLVLDLVLDREPDDREIMTSFLDDDQLPLGSVDRLTYNDLITHRDIVERLLAENVGRDQLELLVKSEIVRPRVLKTWTLDRALFGRDQIDEDLDELNLQRQTEDPQASQAELEFRSWIRPEFFTRTLNFEAELTGMRNAILGTLWMIGITILFAFPIGIGAAVYLEEYAGDNFINRIIQTNIDNLAGVPSIIYGLLGVTVFVRALEPITSGSTFGFSDPTTANGRTILSAAFTMGLLILPIIIINAQEAIQAVQPSIRAASYGLGATKWQTVRSHVLPYAMPGILTGTILAVSRAIGETAPLIVVGAASFIVKDPSGPFSKFTALPMQIYFWTTQPRDADKAVAAAAIIILLVVLLTLNSTAILLRNRFEKKLRGQ